MRSAEHFQPAAPHRRPTRAETTGTRPSTWSRWHRHALPAWAFSCDVDCLEIRAGRGIVAVIETGEVDGLPTEARLRAIAKSKSLHAVGKPIVYLMPAWIFDGMIFVSRTDIRAYGDLRNEHGKERAAQLFLDQLRGKTIALPEGSAYEQAFRAFAASAGYDPKSFSIVNTKLEVGINGLNDPSVGLAAAGIVERLEAMRRGYRIALQPEDLGTLVLTGFVCRRDSYEQHPDIVARFMCGWYESLGGALGDMEDNYRIVRAYIDGRGGTAPSREDMETALHYQRFAHDPQQAQAMFLDSSSPTFWRISWDAAVRNLQQTGREGDAPTSAVDFVGDDLYRRVLIMWREAHNE